MQEAQEFIARRLSSSDFDSKSKRNSSAHSPPLCIFKLWMKQLVAIRSVDRASAGIKFNNAFCLCWLLRQFYTIPFKKCCFPFTFFFPLLSELKDKIGPGVSITRLRVVLICDPLRISNLFHHYAAHLEWTREAKWKMPNCDIIYCLVSK